MKSDIKEPVFRIDGGKRTNLKQLRARRKAKRLADKSRPPIEDTRVSDAWARDDARQEAWKRLSAEQRRIRRLAAMEGGKSGTQVTKVKTRLSAERSNVMAMRASPGTFEWRYGRKQDAMFLAGNHLARLWERAGMTIASSANFLRGTSSGYATGLSEGRAQAIDQLEGFRKTLGTEMSANLIAYCVEGLTAAELAQRNGVSGREMATVLHHLLRQCAKHFKFM